MLTVVLYVKQVFHHSSYNAFWYCEFCAKFDFTVFKTSYHQYVNSNEAL
jgi:hypothetical protein